jgi:hypothetical protein
MNSKSKHHWAALYTLGSDDGEPLQPDAVAELVRLGIVELGRDGKPRLTAYGEKCFVVMESGDGVVPELECHTESDGGL